MAEGWYVGRNGQQAGPFSPQQLKMMANAGQLSPNDLLWKDGMPKWVPCSSVKGLFPDSGGGSGPPPSRPASRPTAPPPRSPVSTETFDNSDTNAIGISTGYGTPLPNGLQPGGAIAYADFLPRVGAALLDGLFLGFIGCIPAAGLTFIIVAMVASGGGDQAQGVEVLANCCFSIVYQLAALIYYLMLETSAKQGTWGKQIVGIKVTDLQGNRISFGRAVGRYFAKIITGFTCGIGLLMPLFTEKKQTLHDMIAGCLSLKK